MNFHHVGSLRSFARNESSPSTPYSVVASRLSDEIQIGRIEVSVPQLVKRLDRVLQSYQKLEGTIWNVVLLATNWASEVGDPSLRKTAQAMVQILAPVYDSDLKVANLKAAIKSLRELATIEGDEKRLELRLRTIEEKLAKVSVNPRSLQDVEPSRMLYSELMDLHKRALSTLMEASQTVPNQLLIRYCDVLLESNDKAEQRLKQALDLLDQQFPPTN